MHEYHRKQKGLNDNTPSWMIHSLNGSELLYDAGSWPVKRPPLKRSDMSTAISSVEFPTHLALNRGSLGKEALNNRDGRFSHDDAQERCCGSDVPSL